MNWTKTMLNITLQTAPGKKKSIRDMKVRDAHSSNVVTYIRNQDIQQTGRYCRILRVILLWKVVSFLPLVSYNSWHTERQETDVKKLSISIYAVAFWVGTVWSAGPIIWMYILPPSSHGDRRFKPSDNAAFFYIDKELSWSF
jgi:hypothetical protein